MLHALEGAVSGLSSGAFAVVMYLVNIPLAFLVPSSSGHATLAMPIMAPLGDFAGVSRAMVVTAYQSASGWASGELTSDASRNLLVPAVEAALQSRYKLSPKTPGL